MVKPETKFLLIFLATIAISRIFLSFLPEGNIMWHDRLFHLYYGMGIIALAYLSKNKKLILLYAIGLGLIVDDIGIIPLIFQEFETARHHYFSVYSWGIIAVSSSMAIAYKKRIYETFLKL